MQKLFLLIVCQLALLVFAAPAHALPDEGFEREFYSDATRTEVVGGMSYFCGSRGYVTWGRITPYWVDVMSWPCSPDRPDLLEGEHEEIDSQAVAQDESES
jgi:hypothetical protein